jgi:hypothetical protein
MEMAEIEPLMWLGLAEQNDDFITGSIEERRQQYLRLAEEADRCAARSAGDLHAGYLKLAAGWRQMAAELGNPRLF